MLTGKFPANKDALSNAVFEKTTARGNWKYQPESMIAYFRQQGYQTIGIGKISHAPDGRVYGYTQKVSDSMELPHSWDKMLFDPGKWGTGWNAFFGYASGENRQSLHNRVQPYEAADVSDKGYPDGLTADLAIRELKRVIKRGQPFFMAVGFLKPHLPFNAPKKYWDLYDEDQIKTAENPDLPLGINKASLHNSVEFNQYKLSEETVSLNHKLSDSYARRLKHAYMAAVSYSDAQVGKLIAALKSEGMDKNTIVILWGDHGWHLGEERVWGKHTLSEYALRSPLIIKIPGMKDPGRATGTVVQTVDIYPTLLDLLDLPQPYPLDGHSFLKSLRQADHSEDRVAYSYFNQGITMRTRRYRITQYYRQASPRIELYDYVSDPLETKNMAAEQPALVEHLLQRLQAGNTGLYDK
ncbi:sulfatase [Niabella terrae]